MLILFTKQLEITLKFWMLLLCDDNLGKHGQTFGQNVFQTLMIHLVLFKGIQNFEDNFSVNLKLVWYRDIFEQFLDLLELPNRSPQVSTIAIVIIIFKRQMNPADPTQESPQDLWISGL